MSAGLRWYNRLAARALEVAHDLLLPLAQPVWEADNPGEEEEVDDSWIDEALRDAYDEGYRDAESRGGRYP